MIHVFHNTDLQALKGFNRLGLSVGDIVMFFLVDRNILSRQAMGFFRLVDGWAASGLVDDGILHFPSTAVADAYWQRIYKGALMPESSPIELVAPGATYTLTHTDDPTMARQYGVKEYSPALFTEYVDVAGLKDGLYARPIDGEYRYTPFDIAQAEDATPKLTLAKKYAFTRKQLLEIGPGPLPMYNSSHGYDFTDTRLRKCADSTNIALLIDLPSIWYEYENNAGTWEYKTWRDHEGAMLTVPATEFCFQWPPLYCIDRLYADIRTISWTGEEGYTKYEMPTDTIHETKIYADGAVLEGGLFVCTHAYFWPSDEWKWGTYLPDPQYIHFHSKLDGPTGGWSDMTNDNPVRYVGEKYLSYMRRWDFAPSSTLAAAFDFDLKRTYNLWLIHADGTTEDTISGTHLVSHDYFPAARPVCGAGDCPYVLFKGAPGGVGGYDSLLEFSSVAGKASYVQSEFTAHDGWYRTIDLYESFWADHQWDLKIPWLNYLNIPSERTQVHIEGLVNDCYVFDEIIQQINPTTLQVPFVAHAGDIQISPELASKNDHVIFRGVASDRSELFLLDNADAAEFPTVGVYDFTITDEFESTALVYPLCVQAVGINSANITVNTPALTEVRVMLSLTRDGQTYNFNGDGWVVHSDFYTAQTLADFLSMDFSTILADLGETVYMNLAMLSLDGTASPEFISSSVEYTRGLDYSQTTTALGQGTNVEITAVSGTQTDFKNVSGAEKYLKCSIFKLE